MDREILLRSQIDSRNLYYNKDLGGERPLNYACLLARHRKRGPELRSTSRGDDALHSIFIHKSCRHYAAGSLFSHDGVSWLSRTVSSNGAPNIAEVSDCRP
jgi:hypothetical protein